MSRVVQISLDIVVGDKCEVEYLGLSLIHI